ncbi:hypothetical protein [Aureimonas mangrovi]|nr:hypothetical protein [Aureimonas mangrovi]
MCCRRVTQGAPTAFENSRAMYSPDGITDEDGFSATFDPRFAEAAQNA